MKLGIVTYEPISYILIFLYKMSQKPINTRAASFLSKFNKKTGWYLIGQSFPKEQKYML